MVLATKPAPEWSLSGIDSNATPLLEWRGGPGSSQALLAGPVENRSTGAMGGMGSGLAPFPNALNLGFAVDNRPVKQQKMRVVRNFRP
jgi:hypothetical protein